MTGAMQYKKTLCIFGRPGCYLNAKSFSNNCMVGGIEKSEKFDDVSMISMTFDDGVKTRNES